MYKLIKKKQAIDYCSIYRDDLLYYSKKKLYLNDDEIILINENILGGYIDFQGVINVIASERTYWFLGSTNDLLFISSHLCGLLDIEIENLRLARTEKLNYSFYNVKLNKVVDVFKAKFDGLYPSAIKHYSLFIHKFPHSVIQSLSLLTGEYEWETNLSGRKYLINNEEQESKIIEILGVYENHLLLWLEGDRLISIDTNNGNILYEILPFEGLLDMNGFQLWDFRNLFLEKETGKIIMLNKLFYYEIDIKTQKVDMLKSFYTGNAYGLGRLPNMPEIPTDITFQKSIYTKDFIYFMGGYTFATNILGVFNRKTYNIDWQESINIGETDKFNNLKDIQYADDKIYVLDTDGVLRIFEKE
jgi:hypothetical protein